LRLEIWEDGEDSISEYSYQYRGNCAILEIFLSNIKGYSSSDACIDFDCDEKINVKKNRKHVTN